MDAIIFDIDGTLCDVSSIRHYVDRSDPGFVGKRDFESFHRASRFAPSHHEIAALARSAKRDGYCLLVVTGRDARWRELTLDWLAAHSIPFDQLFMRSTRDFRTDSVIKSELLEGMRLLYNPIFAVDDRTDIAAVWLKNGIGVGLVSDKGRVSSVQFPLTQKPNDHLVEFLKRTLNIET